MKNVGIIANIFFKFIMILTLLLEKFPILFFITHEAD